MSPQPSFFLTITEVQEALNAFMGAPAGKPAPKPEPKPVPVIENPVLGYRGFKVGMHPSTADPRFGEIRHPRLFSLHQHAVWEGGEMHMECRCPEVARHDIFAPPRGERHDTPGPWHHRLSGCGVHAYHDLNTLIATEEWAAPGAGLTLSPTGILPPMRTIVPDVLGAVIGLGRMRIHPKGHGWRAQRARIVALALHPRYEKSRDRARGLRILAKHYGVPAVASSQLEERAREFGEPRVPEAPERPSPAEYVMPWPAAGSFLRPAIAAAAARLSLAPVVPPTMELVAAIGARLAPMVRRSARIDTEEALGGGTVTMRVAVAGFEVGVKAAADYLDAAAWLAERLNALVLGPAYPSFHLVRPAGIVEWHETVSIGYGHHGIRLKA